MAEQCRHDMANTIGIHETGSQHHEAAALAMNRLHLRKVPNTVAKAVGSRELPCVEFRIASRQPADIAIERRTFIIQW